jgi:hypothetical protein
MDFAQDLGKGWGSDWSGVLFRKSYPDLQDVIGKSRKWFSVAYRFNAVTSTWQWPTGEQLKFRQFAKSGDYWKYHGHAYSWIGWEETLQLRRRFLLPVHVLLPALVAAKHAAQVARDLQSPWARPQLDQGAMATAGPARAHRRTDHQRGRVTDCHAYGGPPSTATPTKT